VAMALVTACGGGADDDAADDDAAGSPPAEEAADEAEATEDAPAEEAEESATEEDAPAEEDEEPAADGALERGQVMMYPGQSYRVPALVADEQGFFAERGIEIEIVDQPGGVTGTQGLAATNSNVGYITLVTAAQGWQAGEDVAFFCGTISVIETSLYAAND